jgi:hypothetical protein
LNARLIIERGKGLLATTREITVDDVFQTLRKYAETTTPETTTPETTTPASTTYPAQS